MPGDFNSAFASLLHGRGDQDLQVFIEEGEDLRRLNVYRNNVARAGIEALRAAYPAVNRIAGENFFSPMARQFWMDHPPAEASLALYGHGFADHVRAYEPARGLPYLPDIARLDRAWLEAHHAADTPVLTPQSAAALPPESLPGLAPGLVDSARLLTLEFTAHHAWQTNRYPDEPPDRVQIARSGQFVLVWRARGEVRSETLLPAHFAFLGALFKGGTLENATQAATQLDDQIDPAQFFSHGLGQALFAADT